MATLPEDDSFPGGVYRVETTDPVLGGPPNEETGAGLINIPFMQLAKRTRWLKTRVDSLLASFTAATTAVAGIVQLSTATNSASDTMAATPSAVKAAMDNANTRALAARTVTGGGLATGGGDLSANRVITVPVATQAQAETGADNATAMTPLRVAQLIAKRIADGVAQAGSAILSAISALATTGMIVRTGAGTVVTRSIAGTGGIMVTNGNGVAGNPTVALNGQVAALDTLATNGLIARTAADTVAARSIQGSGLADVTNGNGVAGNPTVVVTAASQAEAEAGTSDARVMTPLKTAQAIAAWAFESANQTIVRSSVLTVAHGLGYRPKQVELVARCVTAQAPYAVGDEVRLSHYVTWGNDAYGPATAADSTNIKIRMGAIDLYLHNDIGGHFVLIDARWKFVVRAR